jgi:hypothetical protein
VTARRIAHDIGHRAVRKRPVRREAAAMNGARCVV